MPHTALPCHLQLCSLIVLLPLFFSSSFALDFPDPHDIAMTTQGIADVTRQEFDLLTDVIQNHRLRTSRLDDGPLRRVLELRSHSHRNLEVSRSLLDKIVAELVSGKDFSFLATVRQLPRNRGSIIAFAYRGRKRFLEMQSVDRKRELRFHFLFTLAASHIHTERMHAVLADGLWHRVALSVSGTLLELRLDCRRVFAHRMTYPPPQREFTEPHHGVRLWVGQRGWRRSFFRGSIAEAKIVTGPDGYLVQCPRMSNFGGSNVDGQVLQMFAELSVTVEKLQIKLQAVEGRLASVSQCDCLRSCRLKDRVIRDGEVWKNGSCASCICQGGHLNCTSVSCPRLDCKFPVQTENACCPSCLTNKRARKCEFRGLSFEHGELSFKKSRDRKVCVICKCHDGGMRCKQYRNLTSICPKLDCPLDKQFTTEDECCNFCPDMNFCGDGHRCHPNAECLNLATRYACRCRSGFSGNGYHCEDVNECGQGHDAAVKRCGYNSHCINTPGGYRCQCTKGFEIGPYNLCRDIDECQNNSSCPEHAHCINTIGSFKCLCRYGYQWKGDRCVPICNNCINGGVCQAPGQCKCPFGFFGDRCEKDIDECELGLHNCPENSICTNLPGSFFCACLRGFTRNKKGDCRDINECGGTRGVSFTCNEEMSCNNSHGGYQCFCKTNGSCSQDCFIGSTTRRNFKRENGTIFEDGHDPCKICQCHEGVLTCEKRACNCSEDFQDHLCCPECFEASCDVPKLNTTFASGEMWRNECSSCQCQNGTIACHPLVCPVILNCPVPLVKPQGHCCPLCPKQDPWACVGRFPSSSANSKCDLQLSEAKLEALCLDCQCEGENACCSRRMRCNENKLWP